MVSCIIFYSSSLGRMISSIYSPDISAFGNLYSNNIKAQIDLRGTLLKAMLCCVVKKLMVVIDVIVMVVVTFL